MKKLLALILALSILTLAGCSKTDNNSYDVDSGSSEIVFLNNETISNEGASSTETSSAETSSTEEKTDTSSSVPSSSSVPTTSKPATSSTMQNTSNPNTSNEAAPVISKNSNGTTIRLCERTTYCGYEGCYIVWNEFSDFDLELIGLDNSKKQSIMTQYYDADSPELMKWIYFIFEAKENKVYGIEDFIDFDDTQMLPAKLIYPDKSLYSRYDTSQKTIKLFEKTTWRGYNGFFRIESSYYTDEQGNVLYDETLILDDRMKKTCDTRLKLNMKDGWGGPITEYYFVGEGPTKDGATWHIPIIFETDDGRKNYSAGWYDYVDLRYSVEVSVDFENLTVTVK